MQVGMHLAHITFKHLDELGRPQVSYTFPDAPTPNASTHNNGKDNNKHFQNDRLPHLP